MPPRLRALALVCLMAAWIVQSLAASQGAPTFFAEPPKADARALAQGTPGTFASPTPRPATCTSTGASATPSTVVAGGAVSISAYGFQPPYPVTITVSGPQQKSPITATPDQQCRVTATVQTAGDPPGTYSVTLNGASAPSRGDGSLTLSTQFSVITPTPTPPPPTSTPTPVVSPSSCPAASAAMLSSRISPGQGASVVGRGFQPGSTVQIAIDGPNGRWATAVSSAAGSNCQILQAFPTSAADTPGHYTVLLTGVNAAGVFASAQTDFEILGGAVPLPSATADVGPLPTLAPTSTLPPGVPAPTLDPLRPAPIAISQDLVVTGGSAVPVVGEITAYDHTMNITNRGALGMQGRDLRAAAWDGQSGTSDLRLGSWDFVILAQGDTLTLRATTEYAPDTRIVSSSSNVGQTSVQGSTLVWQGNLSAGETLTLRTSLEQTPTTAGALNEPVRAQSLSATTPQGTSLTVPLPPRPLPPPAQRFVQPPPPPVDPATGPRFFPDTGFGVADDNIWLYYHRRGGARTFGSPISRLMLLNGAWVQLFEKGALQLFEEGRVSSVNLLEPPYLSYEVVSDLTLPPVDPDLIALAPDPAAANFAASAQEYVRQNAPEQFQSLPARFYATFLGTVLFRDAFFDGRGDPNLVPGFDLEIWGLPTSRPALRSLQSGEVDPTVALLRFQRGVMIHDSRAGTSGGAALGYYLRSIIAGDVSQVSLANVAGSSPLWGQYDPNAPDWVARPNELAETNLVLVFTREDGLGEAVPLQTPAVAPQPDVSPTLEPDPGPAPELSPPVTSPGQPAVGARLFLEILQPTPTFSDAGGQAIGIASAGEIYRILQQTAGWVQVVPEDRPDDSAVWIQLDSRVRAAIR